MYKICSGEIYDYPEGVQVYINHVLGGSVLRYTVVPGDIPVVSGRSNNYIISWGDALLS